VFSKEDRETIFGATKTCHQVLSESVHLLKAYYVRKYEHIYKAGEDDGVDDSLALQIDDILLSNCTRVIQGAKACPKRQSKPQKVEESVIDEEEMKKLAQKKETKVKEKEMSCCGKQ
jgi:hypothetical protein